MDRWTEARTRLTTVPRFGFDLEGDFNLHRYGRRICLFQVALPDAATVLLDPLEHSFDGEPDWREWKTLLEDPAVTKVIWAAQNDVRALKFCYGIEIHGVFDLFDAARLTGMPKPSLPLLAERYLGITLVKDEVWQTSDWNRRPLSEGQLGYAALDVKYLLPLHDRLTAVLEEKRQVAAFAQRMKAVEAFVYEDTEQPWLKMKGAGALLPKARERLKALWTAREEAAKQAGLAPWRLQANEDLLDAARHEPGADRQGPGATS